MRKQTRDYLIFVAALAMAVGVIASSVVPVRADEAADHQTEAADGPRLWSESCGRCHNKRSPEKFSDAQWDVIVHHMRVRANLGGAEARAVVDFLKSAN